MSLYTVTGRRGYRGHQPGETFEANLDAGAETRALNRGDITLLERSIPTLQPGSFTVPSGWLTTQEGGQDNVEAHRA